MQGKKKCGNKKEYRENWQHIAFTGGSNLKQMED